MQTRRQFIQRSSALAAMASMTSLFPSLSFSAPEVLKRTIPVTGETLPVIGLGTSRTFNVDPDSAEMAPLQEVIRAFVEGGATLIDTAPSYARSEAVTGELLSRTATHDKVFLATKVSSTGRDAGLQQIEASFRALQTDRIDLIQVHNLQDTATQLKLLRELKEQGRIRYIGVTHYLESAHDDLLAALEKEPVDFVQFNYSIGARNAEQRLLPYCADKGIATLINRTYQAGELFARVRGKELPQWLQSELGATSWAQVMLKFVLANPAVTTVIPATSNPRYVVDNLLAGQGQLPDAAQRERIVELFA